MRCVHNVYCRLLNTKITACTLYYYYAGEAERVVLYDKVILRKIVKRAAIT